MTIEEKFSRLGVDNAPGQESLQADLPLELLGDPLPGAPVDFSHGDVDAFQPAPGSLECFLAGVEEGARQAYTPYRGRRAVLEDLAAKLSAFTGCPIDPARNIILAPGTQGALFLAMGACVQRGDPVAFLEPDYFANRKMIEFLDGRLLPVPLDYTRDRSRAGVDLAALEQAFQAGAKVFLFSNPNNPTGVVFTEQEQRAVAKLARAYGVTLLVDSLYARQIFDGRPYCHMCSLPEAPEEMLTIIGPSKTESLSGYRLGVAFGSAAIIQRMEKLLAIMALRCPGYNQGGILQLVQRARRLDGGTGAGPSGHPGRYPGAAGPGGGGGGPAHRGGQLPVHPAAEADGVPAHLCADRPAAGRGHRDAGHGVWAPIYRPYPHQFLPGP